MLALRMHGPSDARLDDIPEPQAGPGTVKVRIACAGICGSDLSLYEHPAVPIDFVHPLIGEAGPHVLGHEMSGHVAEVGEGVEGIAVGDLVAVFPMVDDDVCPACGRGETNLCDQGGFLGVMGGGGAFSEYIVAPARNIFVLPEGFTADTGALVEPLAVAYHAVEQSRIPAGGTAFVVGAGPIGLGLLLCLKAMGAGRVVVSEPSAGRRELAASFGADVIDPGEKDPVAYLLERNGGRGADASFDSAGMGDSTFGPAYQALRKGGTTVVVAMYHGPVSSNPAELMLTEKVCTGSYAYTRKDFAAVIDAIADGRLAPMSLVTNHIQLADVLDGGIKTLLGEGRNTEVKILVTP
ncbi:2,3-butanediol dehydrogenase [Jongsikchunia kroppenstedtii]|uniref:2,3-butanediol dehydrogenase n=1 Tax=Jongsikchunia kroppenstedtii TaxID=1121721 RepID=UPI00047665D5|nr:2,3-butanediol dehydrogenase [Jongsikchunia kroppenstedtii]